MSLLINSTRSSHRKRKRSSQKSDLMLETASSMKASCLKPTNSKLPKVKFKRPRSSPMDQRSKEPYLEATNSQKDLA